MKTLWVLLKTEVKLAVREFSGILFGVMLPVGIMLLLGALYGDKPANPEANHTMLQQAFAAVVTIGICATGLMGIPLTLANYREKRVLKRFQVTPTSPAQLLLAHFLNNFLVALSSSLLVFLAARIFFKYSMIGSPWRFIVIYLLITVSIYSIGMVIASISKTVKTANLLSTVIYFPMFFLSGATIPYEIMPKGLQAFANVMPLTQGIKVLKGVSLGMNINEFLFPIALLAVTAIVCTFVSIKTFKYDY